MFARKPPEAPHKAHAYVPMLKMEAEPGQAKIQAEDIDTHCPSETCLGCLAYKICKYKAKKTSACRQRFESLLAWSV